MTDTASRSIVIDEEAEAKGGSGVAEPETFNPCLWIPELCAEPGHSALEEPAFPPLPSPH